MLMKWAPAFVCVFEVSTLDYVNQGKYFENATACSVRTLKTTVATQLKRVKLEHEEIKRLEAFPCYCDTNFVLQGKSCGLAVEHLAHDQKVVGLIPIQC